MRDVQRWVDRLALEVKTSTEARGATFGVSDGGQRLRLPAVRKMNAGALEAEEKIKLCSIGKPLFFFDCASTDLVVGNCMSTRVRGVLQVTHEGPLALDALSTSGRVVGRWRVQSVFS